MGIFDRFRERAGNIPQPQVRVTGSIELAGQEDYEHNHAVIEAYVAKRFGPAPVESISPPPVTVCPYCGSLFDAPLKRSRKCPTCHEAIVLRTVDGRRVAFTEDQARAVDERNALLTDYRKAFRRAGSVGFTVEQFTDTLASLGPGYQPRDASWRLLIQAALDAMKAGDFFTVARAYQLEAEQLRDEARDPTQCLSFSMEAEALYYRNQGDVKSLTIRSCTCGVCDVDNGRKLAWGDFQQGKFGLVGPLPHVDCAKGFCTCSYSQPWDFPGIPEPRSHKRDGPGFMRGHHFTEYVDDVKTLRRAGQEDEAEQLLLEQVSATEAEARSENWGVAPGYYKQLAVIYRKAHDYDREVEILKRYRDQPHGPGDGPDALETRLDKALKLRSRAQATGSDNR